MDNAWQVALNVSLCHTHSGCSQIRSNNDRKNTKSISGHFIHCTFDNFDDQVDDSPWWLNFARHFSWGNGHRPDFIRLLGADISVKVIFEEDLIFDHLLSDLRNLLCGFSLQTLFTDAKDCCPRELFREVKVGFIQRERQYFARR